MLDLSILLTTYNREADCVECLNTLVPQLTDKIEVFLLDDFHLPSERLESYCKDKGINYTHTGIQKGGKPHWRVPGFALNIGAKLSTGKTLILGNAEMHHTSNDTVEKMQLINAPMQPIVYDQPSKSHSLLKYKSFKKLHYGYPWFMGVPRDTFFNINGYDEDFTGIGWEDTDLSNRLLKIHGKIEEVNVDIIHTWNLRTLTPRADAPNINLDLYKYNEEIFKRKLGGDIIRNENKDWGIL